MRLRENLARDDSVNESGVDDLLDSDILGLVGCGIDNLRGNVDKVANSTVDCASGAVAAIVASEDVARAAEGVGVEGADGGGRDVNLAQAAFAILESGTWTSHTAAV